MADEQRLQELSYGEGCNTEGTDDVGYWAIGVDQLALVVRPEVVNAAVDMGDVAVEEGLPSPVVDFHADVIPSPEKVSTWVLSRITEVSYFLGVSFKGQENEAFALFSAIEGSWRDSAPNCQVVTPMKHNEKSVRELRRLECSINYDRSADGDGWAGRKGRGTPLLLQCGYKCCLGMCVV